MELLLGCYELFIHTYSVLDVGCFAHALNLAGNRFQIPTLLNQFLEFSVCA